MKFQNVIDASRIAAGGLMDLATGLVNPTLRLGVTGLSRSGKTVFITALVHALTRGSRLPVFEAYAQGRITRAYLEPQPDDDLPLADFDPMAGGHPVPPLPGQTLPPSPRRARQVAGASLTKQTPAEGDPSPEVAGA